MPSLLVKTDPGAAHLATSSEALAIETLRLREAIARKQEDLPCPI